MVIMPHLALPVNPSEVTHMQYREDEFIDLQRMPGQPRAAHPVPDNFAYIVLVESTYHTEDNPFCFADPQCPCHEDQAAIQRVAHWVREGLMTPEEATNFILGRTF